jgi:phosphopantetheinyl transferase
MQRLCINRCCPPQLAFSKNGNGKPFLAGGAETGRPRLEFNLSHTASLLGG